MVDEDERERQTWIRRQSRRGRYLDRTCPTCKRPDALSAFEAAQTYQCSSCTRLEEGPL